MDPEGALSLLERDPEKTTPIAKNPEEIIDIRNDFSKMEYSQAVREKTAVDLPQTAGELREKLDEKARQLVFDRAEAERRHNKHVPDTVLREEDEESWERMGWSRERRERIVRNLKELLFITEHQARNAIDIFIASGKTFEEVDRNLTMDSYSSYIAELGLKFQQDRENSDLMDAMQRYRGGQDASGKLLFLQEKLGLKNTQSNQKNDEYIKRFVLDDYFRGDLDREFDTELPQNLYDLAWNLTYHGQELWGLHGKYPVLQMQVRKDPRTGKVTEGRYVVNQANFVRWLRERMFYRYDAFETDEVPNFYNLITIDKGAYATVSLATMIFDKSRYFTDETGYVWEDLFNEVFIEPFDLILERTYDIEHQKVYDNAENFDKAWEQWARISKFTRKIIGQSMVDRAMMLPLDSLGKDSDTSVGEAINTMYLTYFNLADFEGLKKVLGKDSPFFTRKGWAEAAAKFSGGGTTASGTVAATAMADAGLYFGEHQKYFDKAFDKDTGEIKSVNDFLLFINPNWHEFPPQNLEKVLAQMLQDVVAKKFQTKQSNLHAEGVTAEERQKGAIFDPYSLQYAWLKAMSWIGFTGARARNNFKPSGEPSGHQQGTRLFHTDAYRMKYETFGGAGNKYTVNMLRSLAMSFFEGTLSENSFVDYQVGFNPDGTPKYNKRAKTQMEVMMEMRMSDIEWEEKRKATEREYEQKIARASGEHEKKALKEELERRLFRIDDIYKNNHKLHASQMEFNDNAMLVYAKNILGMANPLYDRVMKAKETAFDKFITYDGIFRGPSFHQEEWQDALQSKLFTPLRYIFEANGATQLNQRVRAPVYVGRDAEGHQKWEWREQYLGERMIGHQVLDIPTFWMKAAELPKEEWEARKKAGYRKRRGYVIRPDGKHEIDYNKVQDNKKMVYKQWMLMKLAADLWTHIDTHSTDPLYTLEHYQSIVEAIKNLPGNMVGDEYDMKGARITKPLFSKEQIAWLKRISGAGNLFFRTFMSDIFMGDKKKKESTFGESFGIFLTGVFRGYG